MTGRVHIFSGMFRESQEMALKAAFPGREIVCLDNEQEFAAAIEDIEYLLTLAPPGNYWARAKNLKLLHSLGAGIDHLMPGDGLPPSVIVANAAGLVAEPMAEFGLALVLMLRKQIDRSVFQQRHREWKRYLPPSVDGATLGILGVGHIGAALARKAALLGMRVIGTQRTPKTVEYVEKIYAAEETLSVAQQSDVLMCVLPLTSETRGLIDEPMIRAMKPGSSVANMGRGGIVDEAALVRALEDEHLSGAALDVMEHEPLPSDSPLWDAPNLILTPHIAGGFPEYMEDLAMFFAANVARVEAGTPVPTQVSLVHGY